MKRMIFMNMKVREKKKYFEFHKFYLFILSVPFLVDDEDDEKDYEYNRYPILPDVPYDNLQLQQEYNIEDLPLDDDDDEFFSVRFNSSYQ